MSKIKKSMNLVKNFLQTINEFPNAEWNDCLSSGQIDSKIWLIEELEKIDLDLGKIFLLAGWYGTLARFMFNSDLKFEFIRSFDIDDSCHEIAETLNRPIVTDGWKFKATTYDIMNINYPLSYETLRRNGTQCILEETPNTIINTSCEHMDYSWYNNIPENTLVILQSNNFKIPEHINYIKDINQMYEMYPMKLLLFSGEKELQKYNRYMLIGYK